MMPTPAWGMVPSCKNNSSPIVRLLRRGVSGKEKEPGQYVHIYPPANTESFFTHHTLSTDREGVPARGYHKPAEPDARHSPQDRRPIVLRQEGSQVDKPSP